VSARRPRYRYIAFRVEAARIFSEDEIREALRTLSGRPRLVHFRQDGGLVRCVHTEKEATIASLRGLGSIAGEPVRVATLTTSGTIRKALRRYLR